MSSRSDKCGRWLSVLSLHNRQCCHLPHSWGRAAYLPERHRLLPSRVPRDTLHEPHTPYSEVALVPDVADQAYTTRPANNNSEFESVQFSKTVQFSQINYLQPENVCQLFSGVQSVLHAALDFAAAGLPQRFPLRGHSPIQRRPQHPLHTHVNQSISQSVNQSNTFSDCCTFLCSPRESSVHPPGNFTSQGLDQISNFFCL